MLRKGARDPAFDAEELIRAYAIMGAQRATKLLGLFVRLEKRDGKAGVYLAHLPRIGEYLRRNLAHPAWLNCAPGSRLICRTGGAGE